MRHLLFLTALLAPGPLLANEASPGISTGTYLQATLALLLIVGLLLGAAWLARKVSGGKMFGQSNMRIVGGVALGPRERIVLLEVEDTWLVVGIIPGQIRTLHRLPKGAPVSAAEGKAGETPFSSWLDTIKERRNNGS